MKSCDPSDPVASNQQPFVLRILRAPSPPLPTSPHKWHSERGTGRHRGHTGGHRGNTGGHRGHRWGIGGHRENTGGIGGTGGTGGTENCRVPSSLADMRIHSRWVPLTLLHIAAFLSVHSVPPTEYVQCQSFQVASKLGAWPTEGFRFYFGEDRE